MAHWPNITPPDIPDHFSPPLSTHFLVESSLWLLAGWLSKALHWVKWSLDLWRSLDEKISNMRRQSARPGSVRTDWLTSEVHTALHRIVFSLMQRWRKFPRRLQSQDWSIWLSWLEWLWWQCWGVRTAVKPLSGSLSIRWLDCNEEQGGRGVVAHH